MAEVRNYAFSHKELAELLIQKQDIHEGHWGIFIEFALAAANVSSGPDDPALLPAAIIPVKRIGIQKFDQPSPLTVDAAICNPVKSKSKKLG
jgi:hypothetical protein